MKKRASIVVSILLLAVGFAAISTTLVINGNTKVSENTDDFSVIFTAATLDEVDVYDDVISEDKKTINFSTNDLKTLNQTSVLNYKVSNTSSNYDAEVSVNCKVKDGTIAKYTSIKNELENNATLIKAKETLNGTLTVTLNKTATEEVKEEYVCELTFNAVERDELGENASTFASWTPTYFAFGTPTTANTTDYTTVGKNVFAALDTNNVKGVCINDNGLFCIKSNDYDNSVLALKNHFGESACRVDSSCFNCRSSVFFCVAISSGYVDCLDSSPGGRCAVNSDGSVRCETSSTS